MLPGLNSLPDQPERRRLFGILAIVWAVAVSVLALGWWQVGSQLRESEARELATAARDLANLTRVSQEHAERTFQSADQVIRFVRARYLELGNRLDLTALTEQGVIDAVHLPQVGIIDAQGIYALANRPITGRIDLSDREHFRVHVQSGQDQLFVSRPVLGRATGRWSIQLTRRISKPDGSFAGVVVLSIDPGYFTRFYNDLNLGNFGMAALYGLDGFARARRAGVKEEFGTDATASPLFRRIAAGESSGTHAAPSVVDGVERTMHFRRLERFPLAVVVGQGTNELLANHRRARDALVSQSAIASLLMILLAASVSRYVVRLRRELEVSHRAQRQVQERTDQLNAIFELSPDGFVGFDAEGRVKVVNPAFTRLAGAEGVRLDGLDEQGFNAWLAVRCDPSMPYPPPFAPLHERDRSDPPARGKIRILQGQRVLQVGVSTGDSGSLSRILYFRDVTHETEVEQIKSEFLSTAAHELRTPMASIYGFAEVLLSGEVTDAERFEFQSIIFAQAGNIARILDELLDLARIESRRGKDFKRVDLDVRALAQDVIRAYKPPLGRTAPALEGPDGPSHLFADADKLRQALLNVLSNAYKFSPDGGPVRVVLTERDIAGSRQVGVQVIDQGIGLSPDQTARICERFYRADKSGQRPGSGLGMSIVKEIIEIHGGSVEVTSVLGRGTNVSLWLPVAEQLPEPGAADDAAADAPATPESRQ